MTVQPRAIIADVSLNYGQISASCPDSMNLVAKGRQFRPEKTILESRINNGDRVYMVLRLVDGKPVIYLHSPDEIAASVERSLVPESEFSAIYPTVPIKQHRG